jgi:hypothetical protein
MKILDRLPIPNSDALAFVRNESVRIKKSEIIVWVGLTSIETPRRNPPATRFPAILDTGHTHNLAIQTSHLKRWAGIDPNTLRQIGNIRHGDVRLPLHVANVWLHRNESGKSTVLEEPHCLTLSRGIAVYPDSANYPRLPLLGLRALLSNELHLIVDGQHASVTLRTPDWRTRLLECLA